jgi:pimeloyl-ACP methyl ester carboxylesterase
MTQTQPSIVFCHGLWADGSCFSKLMVPLQAEGYECIAAQYGLNSTAEDVALTRATIGRVSSPAILVGHSYGGSVITGAGTDDRVVGLFTSARLLRTRTRLRRPSSPIFRGQRSFPTSTSRTDASGCFRTASMISLAICPSRRKSSFWRRRVFRNPTCSRQKSEEPPGNQSPAGTSSAKKTARFIPIWSASSRSGWVQPPTNSTAAMCRCSPTPTW